MEPILDKPVRKTDDQGHLHLGVLNYLEGDIEAARDSYQRVADVRSRHSATFMIVHLSRMLDDNERANKAIADWENSIEQSRVNSVIANIGDRILKIIKTQNHTPKQVRSIEELAFQLGGPTRCLMLYFLARELDLQGNEREAEALYRQALVLTSPDIFYSTLAGAELAKRDGTSRPDNDSLDPQDVSARHNRVQAR